MKKFWPVVAVVLVIVVAGAIFLAVKPDHNSSQVNYSFKKACQILTLNRAKQLLGDSITPETNPSKAATSDIDVTSCGYAQQFAAGTPTSTLETALAAEILVRAAKNPDGAANNVQQFTQHKPANAQDVSGYGDKAYWSPSVGQLQILKSHNWYFLTYGQLQAPDRTLDQTKKFADLIINDL